LGHQVLLPARLMATMAPWDATPTGGLQNAIPWNPLLWDGIAQFYPWRHFAAHTLRQGMLPLWDPCQFCGTPFIANSQSAVFYPLNLIFLLFPTAFAFGVAACLHLGLAGTFMYLLLRYWRRSPLSAFLGAFVYMLCGFSVVWLELPTFLSVAAWLPLLLLLMERGLGEGSWKATLAAGVVWGLCLLAGHLQIAFYCLLASLLLGVWHLWESFRQGSRPRILRQTGQILIVLTLGFVLAGPQLLPALELSSMSHRSGRPTPEGYRAYINYAMPPTNLITFWVPDFFGNPADGSFWGPANYAEYCGYVGAFPLLLGWLGLIFTFRQQRPVRFLGALGLIALALALGTPLCALLYFYLPGFGQSGSPARALMLYQLALAALTAFGMDSLLMVISQGRPAAAPGKRKPLLRSIPALLTLLTTGSVIAVGTLMALVIARYGDRINLDMAGLLAMEQRPLLMCLGFLGGGWLLALLGLRKALSPGLMSVLIMLLVVADLFAFGMNYNATCPPEAVYPATEGIRYLQAQTKGGERIFPINRRWSLYQTPPALLPPNAALAYRLYDVAGYDSLYSGRWKRFLNTLEGKEASPLENGNMTFVSNFLSPLADLVGAHFILSTADIVAPGLQKVYDGEIKIFRNRQALPRTFLTGDIVPMELSQTLSALSQPGFPLRTRALVDARQASDLPQQPRKETAGDARIIAYGPTRVEIEAEASDPALLVLSDAFYPGWQAKVGGKPAPVIRTDYILRGVPLSPGKHRVHLRYEPTSFRVGLFIGMWAIGIIMGIIGYALSSKNPGVRSQKPE